MAPPKKNAFYHFMEKRRKELEREGMQFPGGWKDVAVALSEEWQNMSGAEKSQYDPKVKTSGNGDNSDENAGYYSDEALELIKIANPPASFSSSLAFKDAFNKAVSTGRKLFYEEIPADRAAPTIQGRKLKEVEARKKLMNLYNWGIERQIDDILSKADDIADVVFTLIDFNMLCISNELEYFPAEIALVAFSIRRGVIDQYGTVIDIHPESLPVGMFLEADYNRDKFFLPNSPFDQDCRDYRQIHGNILKFIRKHSSNLNPGYLFCMRSNMHKVYRCLDWFCKSHRVGATNAFDLYPYEYLLTGMSRIATTKTIIRICGLSSDPCELPLELLSILEKSTTTETQVKPQKVILRSDADTETSIDPERVISTEEKVRDMLNNLDFWTMTFLGCLHHQIYSEACSKCALSILNRIAYNTIAYFMLPLEVIPVAGVNFPDPDNSMSETAKRKRLLNSWGLQEKLFPDYVTPTVREEERAANVKLQVKLFNAARANNEPIPELEPQHVALIFRPKPPLPEFEIISDTHIKNTTFPKL